MVHDLEGAACEETLFEGTRDELAAATVGSEALEAAAVLLRERHRVVGKVTEDIERFNFNTAIAAIMELANAVGDYLRLACPPARMADPERHAFDVEIAEVLIKLLAPMAPHFSEELWQGLLKRPTSVHTEIWPSFDPEQALAQTIELAVQINGKVKAHIEVALDAPEDEVRAAALTAAAEQIGEKDIRKVVVVPGKLVSIVVPA
jgi:leucyl-tRNA synthetase